MKPTHHTMPQVLPQQRSRLCRMALMLLISAGFAGTAGAAEVSREATVDAKAAEVWRVIGPYCAIADWYPGVETCGEENIDGALHRRLGTADGAEFLEKQLDHSDQTMSYSYAIIEGPLPVSDYKATLSLTESGDQTVVVWSSTFEPDGVSEEEAATIVGGVYETGLEAVRQRFAN